ncbi:hypothetical protein C7999DRAFT_42707 [Corynascus novoguineensis]|uniref:Carboxylic ester hydrolase n=1 Tax=Corynascus novoguineensis TaxID=1126955 RepID=A0AAN7CRB5_9PEZI|nr:hypothetical protein C7999DRAFT_42707 [Corynascus novoguineensis]
MATLRWLTGLLIVGTLASCVTRTADSSDIVGTASSPSQDVTVPEPSDLGSQFVSELIANATDAVLEERRAACSQDSSLVVDLGYAMYRGQHNKTIGLNSWKGIRYAAPPTGNLRWLPPKGLPPKKKAPVTNATAFGPMCPQSLSSIPGAVYTPGNEDCLFLNVYAPPNATGLPVLVWIHGGGYGQGGGTQDMSDIINANNRGFIAVTIQYRLGAFGWLSSSEVKSRGAVNAGLLDQAFALGRVKSHICLFGGDPTQVTIAGVSAGGGSVMYHDIAVKGGLGTLLFRRSIASSPYLPFQYVHDDALPTARYYAFSRAAGCPDNGNVFDCLVGKDTDTLQQASFNVTQSSPYSYWGFWPLTDGPLVGHNANEGPLFVPPTLKTESDLIDWLSGAEFPNLTGTQINTILAANPNNVTTDLARGPLFKTTGLSGAPITAVQVSQIANGQQQRANNIYAEATFACPAYWLASAYSGGCSGRGRRAWLYQYSVPFAFHQTDVAAFLGPNTPNQGADLVVAWPTWDDETGLGFLNLNQTGGVSYVMPLPWGANVTQFADPGLRNAFTIASAETWEGGRKARCDVYLGLAASIPV